MAQLSHLANGPANRSTALPPGLYHDNEIFALERRKLFAKGWLCPGLAAEIAKPGDYLTFSIDDQPIFAIRGEDGAIRSFSNVCLHRMMRLLDGRGNCPRIVCPYHAWTYGIDGRLLGAPHMKESPGFEPRKFGLPEIRTEIWEGWIYVTLDPKSESVADLLRPLQGIVAPYAMAGYVPVAAQDHVWATNWKLLTENFMEGYHLPVAHRKTVGAWFPAEETEFPKESHPGFTWQTFTKDENATYGRAHPANDRLEGRWRFTSVMPTVFPTHMYVLAPDHLWYLSLRPKSIGEVHVRFGAALAPEVMSSLNDPKSFVDELVGFFDRVNGEDKGIVEGLYEGTAAPLARPGRLSWLEREIHDFMGYLARGLSA
ncbi:MAG TPA: SRPBCC family protein [Candidatus Udaeobacter sp.]|nr:SRPBCC family protein [Candidatus Udaeobacter sp.]